LRLAQRQTEQLATASHDIRQPLASLRISMSRLTGADRVSPMVLEHFKRSIEYLDALATRYLGSTRESPPGANAPPTGMQPAPGAPFAVSVLIESLDLMFRQEAETKGLGFRRRSSALQVRGDAMAAMRILSNLLANAVRYTTTGRLIIGPRRRAHSVAVWICDTGPGMTAEQIGVALAGKPHDCPDAATGGSGLGLGIASRLAAQSGFVLRIRSTPGKGSIFSLEMPLA
jgi:signal transduction histidine kinase